MLCFVNGGLRLRQRHSSSLSSSSKAFSFSSKLLSVQFLGLVRTNKQSPLGLIVSIHFSLISDSRVMSSWQAPFCLGGGRRAAAVAFAAEPRMCNVSRLYNNDNYNNALHQRRRVVKSSPAIVLASQLTQRSEEWFALRKDKLTTSTFGTALGFWKGTRRSELWAEKVFSPQVSDAAAKTLAMDWGVLNESAAIERYKSITGREVNSLGFATVNGWLGASPDGVLTCLEMGGGILEVKCPYNKGKPEKGLPWTKIPFYYMPQVQGQMEIMDREWVDLYCWTPNASAIFRVCRDRGYWDSIHGVLREFWFENVVPARECLALGKEEEEVKRLYQPSSTHKLTGLAIFKSAKLAAEAKMLCREIAGHVEFFV